MQPPMVTAMSLVANISDQEAMPAVGIPVPIGGLGFCPLMVRHLALAEV